MNSFENDINILSDYHFNDGSTWESGYNRKKNPLLLGVKQGRLVIVQSADIGLVA